LAGIGDGHVRRASTDDISTDVLRYQRRPGTRRDLVRAADFIGQLGDPDYLRKVCALFYEFHELGLNEKFGYKAPNDLRKKYASFYWNSVRTYIQDALLYLSLIGDGKQWVANMHLHVFDAEHDRQFQDTKPPSFLGLGGFGLGELGHASFL
jgi:hypothetical protein